MKQFLQFLKITLVLMLFLQAGRVSAQCSIFSDSFITNGTTGWSGTGIYTTGGNGLDFSHDNSAYIIATRTQTIPANLTVTLTGVKWRSTTDNGTSVQAFLDFAINNVVYLRMQSPTANNQQPIVFANNGAAITAMSGTSGLLPSSSPGNWSSTKDITFTVPNNALTNAALQFIFTAGSSVGGVYDFAVGGISVTAPTNKTVTAASSSPSVCSGTAITNITHTTTNVTGLGTATGLPTGVTASYTTNQVKISGTPTAGPGTYNYSIPLNGGCGSLSTT